MLYQTDIEQAERVATGGTRAARRQPRLRPVGVLSRREPPGQTGDTPHRTAQARRTRRSWLGIATGRIAAADETSVGPIDGASETVLQFLLSPI